MFLGTHTCTYKINSDVKGLLSFSGIHKEEDIDQAIQGLSPESDIDFYPICIFDENDVQRDPWTAFFYFRLLFNWLYSIKLYIEKVQLTSIMRRHLLLWSEVFKNEWISTYKAFLSGKAEQNLWENWDCLRHLLGLSWHV